MLNWKGFVNQYLKLLIKTSLNVLSFCRRILILSFIVVMKRGQYEGNIWRWNILLQFKICSKIFIAYTWEKIIANVQFNNTW